MRIGLLLLVGLACAPGAFAQVPSITSGGVVNAASWSAPIAPGEMVAIFGTNLATGTQTARPPFPPGLGGTSVTMNGIAAPVAFVSSGQVNAQVPASIAATTSLLNTVAVIVTTAAGSSAASLAVVTSGAPGFFTTDGSGCGQAAALNVKADGTSSLNSTSNSASPGDYIALFGTGFGLAVQQPADGAAASTASPLVTIPSVYVDSNAIASLSYRGLAPTLAGVDQINFQVPAATRNGCAVPVSASQTLSSPSVTISVQNGGGRCSDPPIQSWGSILLSATGTGDSFFSASFPSGPNVQPVKPEAIVYAPDWVGNVPQLGGIVVSAEPIAIRSCAVPGYSSLSAGALQIQPPTGSAVTLQPLPLQSGGVVYSTVLPSGFMVPGPYTISGTPGNSVSLNATMTVGSPIQITSSFAPGTPISSSQPLTVQWTGGDAGSLVRVALISQLPTGATNYSYSYAGATSGSLTIPPLCTGHPSIESGVVCSFGLPYSQNAQISVEVVPNPANSPAVTVPGITGPVRLTWQYSYNFSQLSLGQ